MWSGYIALRIIKLHRKMKLIKIEEINNKISEICRVSPAYNAENATVSQDVQPVVIFHWNKNK